MTPFELLFGRKPRTSLESLIPLSAETEQRGGLNNFVERGQGAVERLGGWLHELLAE